MRYKKAKKVLMEFVATHPEFLVNYDNDPRPLSAIRIVGISENADLSLGIIYYRKAGTFCPNIMELTKDPYGSFWKALPWPKLELVAWGPNFEFGTLDEALMCASDWYAAIIQERGAFKACFDKKRKLAAMDYLIQNKCEIDICHGLEVAVYNSLQGGWTHPIDFDSTDPNSYFLALEASIASGIAYKDEDEDEISDEELDDEEEEDYGEDEDELDLLYTQDEIKKRQG